MMSIPTRPTLVVALAAVACGGPAGDDGALADGAAPPPGEASGRAENPAEAALARAMAAAAAGADSVHQALRPVPLLTPTAEAGLRRYGNAQHLARARALGARPASEADQERLVREGRLVEVPDTTELYVLREMGRSSALLTPDALALLEAVGERFQRALGERGLPPYRVVVTSALRSAADQAALRRTNPNAAAGTSTHEFGTTMDITYEAYAAPARLPDAYVASEPAWLAPYTEAAARAMLERAAAIKSRELQAILGDVLARMQSDGMVYVTLERQQPVYHITVARALASD